MAKIKIDSKLFDRVKSVSETAGYSSADEFIIHAIEKELTRFESSQDDQVVEDRLRGLGYIE